jgi:integrase
MKSGEPLATTRREHSDPRIRSVTMSDANSTAPAQPDKPEKPTPDFPLFAHATGRWAKKIKGKLVYFGPWDDPQGALQRFNDFEAGRAPKPGRKRRSDATHTEAPRKPYPEFPLFAHATGRWAKKILGKLHYFGPWDDPDGALAKYQADAEALHNGRKPRPNLGGTTVKDVVNAFLEDKQSLRDSGELSPRTWRQYEDTCKVVTQQFGKGRVVADLGPDDFAALRRKLAKRWKPLTVGNFVQRVRVLFKYAADNDMIDRPVRFGAAFKRPSKKTLRVERARQGAKLFTADEVRRLLDVALPQVRAMILLGINCGLGNADCGRLPMRALNLDAGWLDYPREKTGMPRRCPLWPETVEAIRAAMARRKEPKNEADAGLVFITRTGQSWHCDTTESPISYEMGKLLRKLHINGRAGLGFYTLRHTFRTVADAAKDQPATDFIMGHEVAHMSSHYRETIDDARLQAVANHVRTWLFAKPAAPEAAHTEVAITNGDDVE